MPDQAHQRPGITFADRLFGLGAGLVALSAYLACLCPTVGPGDSGELTLAAWKLGICHPPGYPVFTWLGRLATFVPFGEPALRANILTALLAAAAVALLYFAARTLPLSRAASVAASLGFGLTLSFWTNALSHEVYSLTLLFFSLALLLALSASDKPRLFPILSFILGLAAAHQPTSLFWVPGLAVLILARRPGRPSAFSLAPWTLKLIPLAFFGLGFSSFLGILFRSLARPEMNWGDPSTPGRFVSHILAAQYRELAMSAGWSEFWSRLVNLPRTWVSEAGLIAALLTLAGVIGLLLSRRELWGLLLLFATAGFGLSYRIPDYSVHLLPAFAALFLVVGLGVDLCAHILGSLLHARHSLSGKQEASGRKVLVPAIAATLTLAALLPPAITHFTLAREYRTTALRNLGEDVLLSLPDSCIYVYGADVMGNIVQYVHSLKPGNRNITFVSAPMLLSRTYWDQLRVSLDLPTFDSALARTGAGPLEHRLQLMLLQMVTALTGRRVFLGHELMTQWFFDSPLAKGYRPVPFGLVTRLVPVADTVPREALLASNDSLWQSYHLVGANRRFLLPAFQQVPVTYALSRNNLAMYCLERGWRQEAIALLDAALSFPTNDEFRAAVSRNLARARVPLR